MFFSSRTSEIMSFNRQICDALIDVEVCLLSFLQDFPG